MILQAKNAEKNIDKYIEIDISYTSKIKKNGEYDDIPNMD